MTKLSKFVMGVMFAFIVMTGVILESSDVQAATTKNFKGNLNATYNNSKQKSKIIIKKISNKKVSIKIILDNDWEQGTWEGNIISENTIQFKLDGEEKIKLKWKNKSQFIAKKPKSGFNRESIQMARRLCYSLNDVEYKQVATKASATKSQAANKYWICGSSYVNASGGKMKLYMKKKSIVIKGKALKCKSKKQFYNMKGKKVKYSKKTLKLAKNCKVVECEGMEEYKYSYSKYCKSRGIKASKNSVGINAGIVVKNGKVSAIYFSA